MSQTLLVDPLGDFVSSITCVDGTDEVLINFSESMNTSIVPPYSDFTANQGGGPYNIDFTSATWMSPTQLKIVADELLVSFGTYLLKYESTSDRIATAGAELQEDFTGKSIVVS